MEEIKQTDNTATEEIPTTEPEVKAEEYGKFKSGEELLKAYNGSLLKGRKDLRNWRE